MTQELDLPDPATNAAAEYLLSVAACPVCKIAIGNLAKCERCGDTFLERDQLSLIPTDGCQEVNFKFSSTRSVIGPKFEKVLRYPVSSSLSDLPYHLDPAHAAIIADLPEGSSVLEIGCGGGQMRDYLAARGVRYIGTDISSERVLPHFRTKGGPDVLADAHFLPFQNERFDLVYSAAVFEHLACPQLAAIEVARVLKKNGQFLGSVFFMEPWHDDSFYHMSPLGVFELMLLAGLSPEYVWPGQGYSGYDAMMRMGNRATQAARFLGSLSNAIYRTGNILRNTIRRQPPNITDDAIVGGAVNWIATA